ncbi:MAG: hypothetical protein D6820_11905, partial [Lentisphaerae bacterium]
RMHPTLWPFFTIAIAALAKIFIICFIGAMLVRYRIIEESLLKGLGRLLLYVFLPALLFSKLSRNINVSQMVKLWVLPLSAILYILAGLVLSFLLRRLFVKDNDQRRLFVAAASLANSGYLPMMLMVNICDFSSALGGTADVGQQAIALISIYILGFTPMLWGVAYPYLSEHSLSRDILRKVINPPFIAILAGVFCGMVPGIGETLWDRNLPFYVVMSSLSSIGTLALPCAMIVLGGNLAYGPGKSRVPVRFLCGVGLIRYCAVPAVAVGWLAMITHFGWIQPDPLLALVILLEAAMPPATNLVVITQALDRGAKRMAAILFWMYILALITLTIYTAWALAYVTG